MDLPNINWYDIELVFLLINLCSPAFQAGWTRARSSPAGCVQTDTGSPAESTALPAVFTACLCPAVSGEHADMLSPVRRQCAATTLGLSEEWWYGAGGETRGNSIQANKMQLKPFKTFRGKLLGH